MSTRFESRYAVGPEETKRMDTTALRKNFLIEELFRADEVLLTYTHYDRYIAGGAMPVNTTVNLETIDPLKASFFLERREMGIVNIGGAGTVTADGTTYELNTKEALYLGRGTREVSFASASADAPAKFYINSAPAHHAYPAKKVTRNEAEVVELGSAETANARTITKLLIAGVIETCQLQMGMTELKSGSVWNTMPAHAHDRRMEVYLYFDVPAEQAVCHFMGEPTETRHIWMQNEQAVISPPWSIHSGSGTSNYTFIWGMAGENLDYGDMDIRKITELR
ncbi:5-dehydro-4-deoxy-D-glucuronate isomerase [Botryobacter ruber]|uniref:5-dehydro-4-deoxy-D-glucuronate isomerase n=1 Tax=Botryobacter ruber TaxID=2171629 RepID=UPI000E0BA314|nr:5-dehydro-4-deoxy-D-glucuronate isomerase [Botryobacter ruber]